MNIINLKDAILNNAFNISLLIFLCKDGDHFLANQYIDEICIRNKLKHNPIDSLSDLNISSAASMVLDLGEDLNILRTDTFAEEYDYNILENTVIVCDKIDKKIQNKVQQFVVEMPKLLDWQIKAHMANVCPKLCPEAIDWLYTAANENVTRIENELDKIKLFDNDMNNFAIELKNDESTDLYNLSTFTFTDALIKKDKIIISDALAHRHCWDSDPMFILTILLNKYKQIALINGNSGLSAESMKLTQKQYNAIKYYYKNFNIMDVMNKIDFLSGVDLKIRLGELDIQNKDLFLDYLVNNILS